MNSSQTPKRPDYVSIRIEDFEPSWSGPHPFDDGFCIGSEDGRVAFTDENGMITDQPDLPVPSREAINGIAGFDNWLAISTRNDLTIRNLAQHGQENVMSRTFEQGMHGIIRTSNKLFAAPLGHDGVTIVNPLDGLKEPMPKYGLGEAANFYQICELPSSNTDNLFIAACRSSGVVFFVFSSDKNEIIASRQRTSKNADFVDVMTVVIDDRVHAIVAARIDGEMVVFRKVDLSDDPLLLNYYHQFNGKTYRILNSCGHVFVLTSKALYVLGNLAGRLTHESLGNEPTPVMTIPMEAIDANICGNRWLLIVMPEEIRRYDVHQIHDLISEFAANSSPGMSAPPDKTLNAGEFGIEMKPILVG